MRMIVLLLGITLEASAASGFRILSECDEAAEVRAHIAKDAQVEIHSSVSGGSPCYSVTATVEGKQIHGYVIDSGLDAVLAFEKAKTQSLREALSAAPVPPSPPATTPPPPPAQSTTSGSNAADAAKPAKEVPKSKPTPVE
jgi:hypothetical protein